MNKVAEHSYEKNANKKRLDAILMERGLAKSRTEAKALIMSGIVYVNDVKEDKAGAFFSETENLKVDIRGDKAGYVSRGGLKLEKAIKEFGINLSFLTCMDVGASTGGFTDLMLKNGAKKVYAVDVGYGLIDWRLRNDPRVFLLEKTNIRYLTREAIDNDLLDFAAIDVSFISLKLVLPALKNLLKDGAGVVCLIKPQFEAGKNDVGKNGIIKDLKIHERVSKDIAHFAMDLDFDLLGFSYSPIKGHKGNIEFLLYISKLSEYALRSERDISNFDKLIEEVVLKAHSKLK